MNDYPPPIDQFLGLGEPDGTEQTALASLVLVPEHIPDLIRMATDRDLALADSESLEVWAPFHAWRALGSLRAEEAVEPLLEILDFLVANDDEWAPVELPEVFASIGPAAIPALAAFLADSTKQLYARVSVVVTFRRMARDHPLSREECVAVLIKVLDEAEWNHPVLNGFVLGTLLDLEAVESGPVIKQAFDDNLIDCSIAGDWEDVQCELGLGGPPPPRRPEPLTRSHFMIGAVYHADPANAAKRKARQRALRKLAKKSRKQSRKRR